jgi:diaminopropionate ammonia-lyase
VFHTAVLELGAGERIVVPDPARLSAPWSDAESSVITLADSLAAENTITHWPPYRPSAIVSLPHTARSLGFASVCVKNEGDRFAVQSFKPLGPPYSLAIDLAARIAGRTGESVSPSDLWTNRFRGIAAEFTACAATSGNHGRALAWAARQFGCRCVVLMPQGTSQYREDVIRSFGAETVRIAGNYDSAHAAADEFAKRPGWILVADSPGGPNPDAARRILHGYSVVGAELLRSVAAGETPTPTHLFVPAGSGLMAAGLTARLSLQPPATRPRVVVVEPAASDSVVQSLQSGARTPANGAMTTFMDGLSVRWVSETAWPILERRVFAGLAVCDTTALYALRMLVTPPNNDPGVDAGETGVCAFAGLIAAARTNAARSLLELDEYSRVVVVVSEGCTDPGVRQSLIEL